MDRNPARDRTPRAGGAAGEGEPAAGHDRVFVYGTLRSGGAANHMLSGGRLIGGAKVSGSLFDLGAYPALVLDERGTVYGEVWSCSPETLAGLDAYEGVEEGLFVRVRVPAGGQPCWTYVAGAALRDPLASARRLPDGRWNPGPFDPDPSSR